jgi:hypothetical protein
MFVYKILIIKELSINRFSSCSIFIDYISTLDDEVRHNTM